MLPLVTPDKELCLSPVDGCQEDSSQQFCHLRVDYYNSLLVRVPHYQLDRLQSVLNDCDANYNRRIDGYVISRLY